LNSSTSSEPVGTVRSRSFPSFPAQLSRVTTPLDLPEITAEARLYSLRELSRRAGVSQEFFDSWVIQVTPTETTVQVGQPRTLIIRFLHGPAAGFNQHLTNEIPVSRVSWPYAGQVDTFPGDLLLPFCRVEQLNRPLYENLADGSLRCNFDVLASFVLTLSRVEESLRPTFDEHGRFPAENSIAFQEKFLDRPFLEEHGIAFQQALAALLPGWKPESRAYRVKLTHDIDDVGIPFELRAACAHTFKRRSVSATLRDFLSTFSSTDPVGLALVRKLAEISQRRGLHSAFFWKHSPRTNYDSGYSPDDRRIQAVIEELRRSNFEIGVHPGYDTFHRRESLTQEIERLKRSLGENYPGGRQHYLRWSPQTWLDWEACGLRYDSSVGFADHFGFRAGTAYPFRPWCWSENRALNLIELPLVLMDCTPVSYMKLELRSGLEKIRTLIQRVQATGGVFTLLWHNMPLIEPAYEGWYEGVLDLLDGSKPYEVPRNAADLW